VKAVEITYRYLTGGTALRERPADAPAARRRLEDGNKAFAALLEHLDTQDDVARRIIYVNSSDLGIRSGDDVAPPQRPFAAVLGCSDARVPVELIFNEGPNDLFIVRVAGNALGNDVLGSLKYAIDHLGDLKLIVVLGHSGCGAVSAAVDVFLDPAGYLSLASEHALRGVLDRIMVVVHASAKRLASTFGADVTKRPHYRDALIEISVTMNAALAAFTVQEEIASSHAAGLRAAYGVYLLANREIWAPRYGGNECAGLADPPRNRDDFVALADSLIRSERIAALLE
jgi:carbonic anhydrase